MDDPSFLRAYCSTGDESAFAELVQRHFSLVYNTARRLVTDAATADDVTQIVFTRLARKAHSLIGHPSILGWLHTTTRMVARETLRSEGRRRRRELNAFLMQNLADSNQSPQNWEQLRPIIDHALGELKEADRAAVLLRYFANLPLAAIGERLNVSENTARMRIERALDKLQVQLERRGIKSSTAALAASLAQQTIFAAPTGACAAVTTTALMQAGATSAGFTALRFIQMLTTAKTTAIVATGIALAALGTVVHQVIHTSELEAKLAQYAREKTDLSIQLTNAQEHTRQLEATVAKSLGSDQTPRTALANVPVAPPPPTMEEAINRLIVAHPDLAALYVRAETLRFRSKYGPLYQTLGFSTEQIRTFERVLGDYAQSASDIRVAGLTKGLKADDPAVIKLLDQASQQRETNLRQLLGEDDYSEYHKYETTYLGRALSDRLASETYYTNHPLSLEQADALARIAINNSARVTNNGIAAWDNIIHEAEQLLTTEQIEVIRRLKEQAELGMQIGKITTPATKNLVSQ